jgi:hypothetical protein
MNAILFDKPPDTAPVSSTLCPAVTWSRIYETIPAKRTVQSVDLDITEACNLACIYCFKWQKKAVHMSEETAKSAIDWLLEASGSFRAELKVNLMGGEPLLRFDLIQKIVPYGKLRARQLGKNLHFGCTTNCTVLTDEMLAFWRRFGMGFHCSMLGEFYLDGLVSGKRINIEEFAKGIRSIHSVAAHSRFPCGANLPQLVLRRVCRFDLTIKAFGSAFSSRNDVSLILRIPRIQQPSERGSTFSRLEALVNEQRAKPGSPEIVLLEFDVEPNYRGGVYTGADCYEHQDEARALGQTAAQVAHREWTWKHAATKLASIFLFPEPSGSVKNQEVL